MPELFEAYDDLEEIAERARAADAGERRVAVIALGNSGDPAAISYLEPLASDPDSGVRQQRRSAGCSSIRNRRWPPQPRRAWPN
jgi:HEAT repeat protein